MDKINVCDLCEVEFEQDDDIVKCNGVCIRKYHVKCLKFNASVSKHLRECKNIQFICVDCIYNQNASLNETVIKLISYMQIIDERVKRNDEKVEGIYGEIRNINDVIIQNSEQIKTEIKKAVIDDKIRGRDAVTLKKANPTVVLQPKKSQKSEVTKLELTKNIDPKSIRINDVHVIPNGGIAINCKSNDETKKLKDEAVKKWARTIQ